MKKLKIFSAVLALIFAFAACDKVEPPYQTGFDCSSGNQKVLIEDYTGHTCVNCPGAAIIAHDIQSNCEERVIIISVHAGYFAEPLDGDYSYDFRTQAGNEWNDFFGIISNPNGTVNRINNDGNYILSPGQWAAETTKLLAQNSPVNINIFNTFNSDENKLTAKIDAEFVGSLEGNYDLIVCLTEDHIIQPQKNNDHSVGEVPDIFDYEHNHVLRKTLSNTWGDDFLNGSYTAGTTESVNYELSFEGTDWKPENCSLVAFIVNPDDKSIFQVNEEPLIQ